MDGSIAIFLYSLKFNIPFDIGKIGYVIVITAWIK